MVILNVSICPTFAVYNRGIYRYFGERYFNLGLVLDYLTSLLREIIRILLVSNIPNINSLLM